MACAVTESQHALPHLGLHFSSENNQLLVPALCFIVSKELSLEQ